jgi:subtilisin family serine protease
MKKKIVILLFACSVLLTAKVSFAGYLAPSLITELESLEPGQRIEVIIHMKEKANLDDVSYLTKPEKVQYLKDFAKEKQSDILGYLSEKSACEIVTTWWVFNGFLMEATEDVINDIVKRDDVDYIIDNFYQICIPKANPLGFPGGEQPTVQWNIEMIRADEVWTEGYDGAGIVIGTMDTGVDYDHSALFSSWRPNSGWYDAINGQATPYDDNGHGTGTMGIMVGAYGIGVAPGVKWVSAKVMNSAGGGTAAQFHNGFSWIAGLASSGMEPRVVSNSWGWGDRTSTEYWDDCDTWKGLGILPVFAIANDGPGASTDDAPGNYPLCLGVGATDSWDDIADFSSRGPAPNISPWNVPSNWYRSDWNRTKPDISAPGVGIFTCAPLPDEYQAGFGGTSGASPHVGGVCALILQKNPSLTPTELYNIITNNAAYPTQGMPYPNNDYGWGRIDAYKVVSNTPEPTTPCIAYVSRVINDGGNGELDPGESSVTLIVTLKNMGKDATNVAATLSESNMYVSVNDATGSFGNIGHGASASNSGNTFQITAVGIAPAGERIDFTLDITADGGYSTKQWFSIYIAAQASAFHDTLSYHGDPAYFWRYPDAYGDSLFNERFTTPGACSLLTARFLFYLKSGSAGIRTYVWQSTGAEPGAKIDSVDVAYGSINTYPTWTNVDYSSKGIHFSAGESFHIGYMLLNYGVGDSVDILSDDGSSGGERSYEWYAGAWSSMLDDWGLDLDFHIQAVVEGGIAGPAVMYDGKYIDDRLFNNNNYMDPGETVNIIVSLSNAGLVASNVQVKLRTTDANCTLIDSTADYGNIQKDMVVDNSADPFTVRLSDLVANGYTVSFTLHIEANGGGYSNDQGFSVESEYVPQPSDLFMMSFTEGDLYYNSDYNGYWWAQYFNPMTPCSLKYFWIYTYLNGSGANGTVYVWGHDAGNFQPDVAVEYYSSGGLAGGWQRYDVDDVVPGEFWIGFDQVNKLEPVFSVTENGIALVSTDDGSTWPYLWYDLAIEAYMRHFSPVLTYITPDGWDFSIVPSDDAADSTFPASLPAEPSLTYVHDWCSWNRSDTTITADFDNLLIRDYFGEVIAEVTGGLAPWYYTSLDSVDIVVPGGRHTLWEIIDYYEEVPVYSGNWPYMFIGKQFIWEPMPVTYETSYLEGPPASITPFSGPYYNCDGYVMDVPSQWAGFGVRKRDWASDDTTDIDVRLFSDYSGIFSGYSDMLATSALGEAEVDFVLVDGNYAGGKTNHYPGVYAFYGFDSTYVQASSKGLLEKGSNTLSDTIRPEDVLMVWDRAVSSGVPDTVIVNVVSGSPDIALAFYEGTAEDPYERRMDYVATADNNGAGGNETLIYTHGSNDTLGLVLWCNNGQAGRIEIPGVLLGIELTEFTATANPGLIKVQWTTASEYNVSKFLIKRSIGENDYVKAEVIGEMEGHINSPTPNTYTFEDRDIHSSEIYYYWLVEVKTTGAMSVLGSLSIKAKPLVYSFTGSSSNPAYDKVSFVYSVPGNAVCNISIYDIQGRLVKEEKRKHVSPGFYTFLWTGKGNEGKRVSDGIYFVRFNAGDFRALKKIVLVR